MNAQNPESPQADTDASSQNVPGIPSRETSAGAEGPPEIDDGPVERGAAASTSAAPVPGQLSHAVLEGVEAR
jgi:hypothetical protein